jgi:antitoxin VapB
MTLVKTAKLFMNGRSQAVQPPEEFRFESDEVVIKRVGNAVALLPRHGWDTLFQALESFEPNFPLERDQPSYLTAR